MNRAIALLILSVFVAVVAGLAATANVATRQPFENLAQNLPEAFSALEEQFKDAEFKSMLTSQLSNPSAVEMFQSLIHDPKAVNSISSLLDDPAIQSSLSAQFASQYPPAALVTGSLASPHSTHSPEATGDYSSSLHAKSSLESEVTSKHSVQNGCGGRPRILVVGWLITLALTALAPV
ncbi:hypothetical protein GQ54DRAFT_209138 [Martensiomyces pterosporus]|nr:hypothetical protein GQ54DRAFT_209138 [Martensiomyces pterosporus]